MKISSLLLFIILSFTLEASGFAGRYWDCCRPICSWPENSGGKSTRHCDASMNPLNDEKAESMCDGGPSTTCLDQIPIVVNDNLAYAFAAVPGKNQNVCGQCFELMFNGEGRYETRLNHKKLAGKKLIVIAKDNRYDEKSGQFDILIPGGGVGLSNGCANIFGNDLGKQYGGLFQCQPFY